MAQKRKRRSARTILKESGRAFRSIGNIRNDPTKETLSWEEVRGIYRENGWNPCNLETAVRLLEKAKMTDGKLLVKAQRGILGVEEELLVFWFGADLCASFEIGNNMPTILRMSRYDELTLELEFGSYTLTEQGLQYRVKARLGEECLSDEIICFSEYESGVNEAFNRALKMCPPLEISQVQ